MSKRLAVRNKYTNNCPNEISLMGFSKMGSHTARMADSKSCTRVCGGTQPHSTCNCATS